MGNSFENPFANVPPPDDGPEKVVVKKEKKTKKPEMAPLKEQEVIDALNTGDFRTEIIIRLWNRYNRKCYLEAKAEATDEDSVDELHKKKMFDTLQKTRYADLQKTSFEDFLPIIKGSENKKDSFTQSMENQEFFEAEIQKELEEGGDPEENLFATAPKPPIEQLADSTPEVAKLEQMMSGFEVKHDINALLAINMLSEKEIYNHPMRTPAKKELGLILAALNNLWQNTNVAAEERKRLNDKFDELSRAVGMVGAGGRVDHLRGK